MLTSKGVFGGGKPSGGSGNKPSGSGSSSPMLDLERKQELIMAKQVRQGTVVIQGTNSTNTIREISPFHQFEQASRLLREQADATRRSPSLSLPPSPNPEAIKKASSPIALRYWNQCMQNGTSNSSPEPASSSSSTAYNDASSRPVQGNTAANFSTVYSNSFSSSTSNHSDYNSASSVSTFNSTNNQSSASRPVKTLAVPPSPINVPTITVAPPRPDSNELSPTPDPAVSVAPPWLHPDYQIKPLLPQISVVGPLAAGNAPTWNRPTPTKTFATNGQVSCRPSFAPTIVRPMTCAEGEPTLPANGKTKNFPSDDQWKSVEQWAADGQPVKNRTNSASGGFSHQYKKTPEHAANADDKRFQFPIETGDARVKAQRFCHPATKSHGPPEMPRKTKINRKVQIGVKETQMPANQQRSSSLPPWSRESSLPPGAKPAPTGDRRTRAAAAPRLDGDAQMRPISRQPFIAAFPQRSATPTWGCETREWTPEVCMVGSGNRRHVLDLSQVPYNPGNTHARTRTPWAAQAV